MKLLFDQSLSPNLVNRLTDAFGQSNHDYLVGLDQASDSVVWNYARENGYIIVTRDADFSEMSVVQGFPPKVVWIRRGNCSTGNIEAILRAHFADIEALDQDSNDGVLVLL